MARLTLPLRQVAAVLGVAFLLATSGCATADLRPPSLRGAVSDESLARGHSLWQESLGERGGDRWAGKTTAELTLRDTWESSLLRWFTPLESNEETLRGTIRLREDRSEFEVVAKGDERKLFRIADAGYRDAERQQPDSEIQLYLESLQLYFELPFREPETIAYAGERALDGRTFDLLLMSDGPLEPARDRDQYLVWLSRETNRPEVIEITYRDVLSSYRGALHYGDWRLVDGMLVPFRIAVTGGVEDRDPVHTLTLESVRFQ